MAAVVTKTYLYTWVFWWPVHQEEEETIEALERCAVEIKAWVDKNGLCMNSKKTEYINFGSFRQLKKNEIRSIDINGDIVAGSTCIRYLRVSDQQLNFKHDIAQNAKQICWPFRDSNK